MWLYCSLVLLFFFLYRKHRSFQQRMDYLQNLRTRTTYTIPPNIMREEYTTHKATHEVFDVIIIGSDIGSLSTAACLSKFGKRVLVLEKGSVVDGYFPNIADYECETPVHYGVDIQNNQFLNSITNTPIVWEPRNQPTTTTTQIHLGKLQFSFSTSTKASIRNLCVVFPKEESVITQYFDLIERVSNFTYFLKFKVLHYGWLRKLATLIWCREYYYYASRTTYEVLLEFTDNERLIAALCSQFVDLGLPPHKSSFFAHACSVSQDSDSLFPLGGSRGIVNSLLETIYRYGGRVLVNQGVKKILVTHTETSGVCMENRDQILAPTVISGVGFTTTFQNLLPSKVLLHKTVTETLLGISPQESYIGIYLSLSGNPHSHRLPTYNICDWGSCKLKKLAEELEYRPIQSSAVGSLTFPCTRDSSWDKRHPNKSNAVLISPVSPPLFKRWKNLKKERHRALFGDFTTELGNSLIVDLLLKHYPDLKSHLEYATIEPLIPEHTSSLENSPTRFTTNHLTPYTPYRGLYITGQDLDRSGFLGHLKGSILCCSAVLGYGNLRNFMVGSDLLQDLTQLCIIKSV